ncbi:MAG: ABC transporter substrate-binding protein [Rhodocyclaceae bacterium]|nr:ABC transporter substrate-binding protein [Rhodocyclaceae bacterium]
MPWTRPLLKYLLIAALFLALLGLLRFKPWQQAGPAEKETLAVGFLPVTCHLTCPVTDFATQASPLAHYQSQRFTDFPTMVESIKSGRLQATFMIVPLAMKLREQGVPVKIMYLGHREGSTIMVRSDSDAKSMRDLRGKVFAIPSKYSNQNLVVHKLMQDQGVGADEIRFVELPPPDMPGALAARAIDGYFVGEPHAAKAELNGTGRVLYHAHDIWPNFISCALVVHENLLRDKPQLIADLVRGIAESGQWAETHREQAAKIAAPYFQQDEKLLRFVLSQPGRVSYVNLNPADSELEKIAAMALELGVLEQPVRIADLVDRRFVPAAIKHIELAAAQAKP